MIVNPAIDCGHCRECRANRANLCTNGGLVGRDVDGGFTAMIAVDEDRLLPVPAGYPIQSAVSLQVLGTCVHAQSTVTALPGQTSVVIGLGVSGLLMVQLLRARGLRVLGVTRSAWKRALGERLGATAVTSPDYQRGIDLAVSGVIDLAPLYTHEFPLSRAHDAFAALEGDPKALKVALNPAPA